MLHELRVENLLLIERAELRLLPGLNVLTGETGAGKTVLAHALDLLLGGRSRPGIVRPGAGEAYVEETRRQLPTLPAHMAYTGISVLPGGLRVSVSGKNVTLSKSMFGAGSCKTA